WRFDGTTLYLLRTAINDPDGGWDGARPLYVNADSGQVFLGPNTKVNGNLYLGDALVHTDGNIYGTLWGGYLNNWINNALTARDNNINVRATIDWVNQNFITRVKRGEPVNPGKVNEYGPAEAPAGCVVTSVRHDPTTAYGIYFTYRPLSIFINGGWRVIEG
ncbi:hypothetical protein AA464_28030, partial [Salmonella enterica subsp. enterica serovar Newport]|nr:hypothetical protein [Salmonella enterica subsp. enterica serovar Newport]